MPISDSSASRYGPRANLFVLDHEARFGAKVTDGARLPEPDQVKPVRPSQLAYHRVWRGPRCSPYSLGSFPLIVQRPPGAAVDYVTAPGQMHGSLTTFILGPLPKDVANREFDHEQPAAPLQTKIRLACAAMGNFWIASVFHNTTDKRRELEVSDITTGYIKGYRDLPLITNLSSHFMASVPGALPTVLLCEDLNLSLWSLIHVNDDDYNQSLTEVARANKAEEWKKDGMPACMAVAHNGAFALVAMRKIGEPPKIKVVELPGLATSKQIALLSLDNRVTAIAIMPCNTKAALCLYTSAAVHICCLRSEVLQRISFPGLLSDPSIALGSGILATSIVVWQRNGNNVFASDLKHRPRVLKVGNHPEGDKARHSPGYYINTVASSSDGKCLYIRSDDNKVIQRPFVSAWTDRNHAVFSRHFKKIIFYLMCVFNRLSKNTSHHPLPRLPLAMWLEIFGVLCVIPCIVFNPPLSRQKVLKIDTPKSKRDPDEPLEV